MPVEESSGFQAEVRKLRDCLQGLHFLHRLKINELEELMAVMKKQKIKKGQTVFKEGDKGESFYMISSGRFELRVRKGGEEKSFGIMHNEDYFGEAALISDAPKAATVICLADGELYLLHKADFQKTLMANPEIAVAIKAHMATRKVARER